jgi:hypothetical protein
MLHPTIYRSRKRSATPAVKPADFKLAERALPSARALASAHECRATSKQNVALCTTTKLIIEWQRWVTLGRSAMSAQCLLWDRFSDSGRTSRDVRHRPALAGNPNPVRVRGAKKSKGFVARPFWSARPPRGRVNFDPSFALGALEFSVDDAQRARP